MMNSLVANYVDRFKNTDFEETKSEFDTIMKLVGQFKEITPETQLLEIGTGAGWFQIRCKQLGIRAQGIDIDPELAAVARDLGRRYGVRLDITVGSIESTDIGTARYDLIVATSTFEHVKDWRKGLEKIAAALKEGGVLYFYSTNKFSFRSGEYWIPLYGWLPDRWRYRLRSALQGEAIMDWRIDSNQFTYPQLRRFFKRLGFSRVLDRADVLDPNNLNHPTPAKRLLLRTVKKFSVLKHAALVFSHDTLFICIK
jgi:2-polyprenyl-3-methyl-5-hydroxy-6-metoxy-1,4-benzoquinol methylase